MAQKITAALVKQLREMTDSPMMECKKALVETDGDIEAAVDVLRTRGLAAAAKKATGFAREVAKVVVENNPSTAEELLALPMGGTTVQEELTELIHIIKENMKLGRFVRREGNAVSTRDQVPAEVVEHEKSIYKEQAAQSGKPEEIQERMATGRLEKFYKQTVLCEQEFIKDSSMTVADYVEKTAKSLDDEIAVAGFERFVLGEE